MATTNKVKGWTGVLMTEDSSSHWPIKRRYVYSETSRRASLEFVCIFGRDEDAPEPRRVESPAMGKVSAIPKVGGLHHYYTRRAA